MQFPSPKSKPKKLWLGLGLVILAALLVFAFLWWQQLKQTQQNELMEKELQAQQQNVSQEKSALLGSVNLEMPEISSAEMISENDIPVAILFLTPAVSSENLSKIKTEKLNYEGEGTGYKISYQISNEETLRNQVTNFQRLISQNGWTLVQSNRASNFAFIEAESLNYTARISLSQTSATLISVELLIAGK